MKKGFRKIITLDEETKYFLALDALKKGTNLKAYIEKLCRDKAGKIKNKTDDKNRIGILHGND